MQLETVIPPHGALASLGIAIEDFVIVNALVMAHRNTGAVDETNARTLSEAEQLKKQHHLHRQAALNLHEAVIGELVWKQIRQMSLYKE
jgi:carbonic anhydrase